jgi:Flp pilus assembly protein TadD
MLSLTARLGWVLIALAAALPVCADDAQEAAKLLKAGQHKQALDLVNKVLASKPRDAQARFLKGLIFTEQGKTKDAIEIFTKLTQDYPELPEPYNNLAVIYASQEQYDKALQIDSSNAAAKNKLSLVRELVASPHAKARTTAAGRSTSAR